VDMLLGFEEVTGIVYTNKPVLPLPLVKLLPKNRDGSKIHCAAVGHIANKAALP
jgi:hypothetical protein